MITYDPLAQMIVEFEKERSEVQVLLAKIEKSIATADDAFDNLPFLTDLHEKIAGLNDVIESLDVAVNRLREIKAKMDEMDMEIIRDINKSFE